MVRANKWANWLDDLLSGDITKINTTLATLASATPKRSKVRQAPVNNLRVGLNNTAYVPRQIAAKETSE